MWIRESPERQTSPIAFRSIKRWCRLGENSYRQPTTSVNYQEGRSYTFQNYRDLKKSFKTEQTEAFEALLNEVKTLTVPHWKVRASSEPKRAVSPGARMLDPEYASIINGEESAIDV